MIRDATEEDFEIILDMCEEFWQHTMFDEPFERDHTIDMIAMCFDHGLLAVIENNGVIEGFCAAVKSPLLGSTKALTATELAWWVSPQYRSGGKAIRLLRHMEKKAKLLGIKYWNMASMETSNPGKANKIYEKMGYKHSESVYSKVI